MNKINNDVWVFIEQRDGTPADVSFELLSKGRKIADNLKSELKAVILGDKVQVLATQTFQFGVNEAIVYDHKDLAHYMTLPYSRLLSKLVSDEKPRVMLYGATVIGRDLAPRVASFTKSGLTADCTDLQVSDVNYLRKDYKNLLLQIRPAFGGNIIATIISPDVQTQMATVREGVMRMEKLDKPIEGRIRNIEYVADPIDSLVKLIEQHRKENKVNLKAAPIIVAGGYGMKTKENFALIQELANVIGGEVAGSRAAVDAGFIPSERQVGQTGVTVRPKLYIACGISGAIQHRAGMQEANKIIAINSDPDAPIFGVAHYGIVGDVMEIIPRFINEFKLKLR
ncbi:MAG: electron transfer flavoprotein subunit alpha/FixB family protein [Ignavibacteria bacterium]|jgi:electron transfer flavoprotein alpha subunit|nr:electron transfer flavoprotein subunit alpha/FixB family protein [Ignavibacteria bacterium]